MWINQSYTTKDESLVMSEDSNLKNVPLQLPNDISVNMQARMFLALGTAAAAAAASFTLLIGRQWPKPAAAIVATILAIGALYLMLFAGPIGAQTPVYE